jgi:hypothetical protein
MLISNEAWLLLKGTTIVKLNDQMDTFKCIYPSTQLHKKGKKEVRMVELAL